ncbi:MAG: ATP-binding cassette domain-containing protein [Fibrobacterota bacterium]
MNKTEKKLQNLPLKKLLQEYPFLTDFFAEKKIFLSAESDRPLAEELQQPEYRSEESRARTGDSLLQDTALYIEQMEEFLYGADRTVHSVSILPGTDKSGTPEGFERIDIERGQIISIVGPTGSGKSRLLADIEWLARADTPTGRSVLVNGRPPKMEWRYSNNVKMVAQLSQNMNFVMDLSVERFLHLHAESRFVDNAGDLVEQIIHEANRLAGERFSRDTAITALSGGQSRALMIADTAILSSSPIVLIDEIENAGIDKGRALDLLLSREKIVLMATHDPILALMGDRRLIIHNGGIADSITVDDAERAVLEDIKQIDKKITDMRNMLRTGKRLDNFTF